MSQNQNNDKDFDYPIVEAGYKSLTFTITSNNKIKLKKIEFEDEEEEDPTDYVIHDLNEQLQEETESYDFKDDSCIVVNPVETDLVEDMGSNAVYQILNLNSSPSPEPVVPIVPVKSSVSIPIRVRKTTNNARPTTTYVNTHDPRILRTTLLKHFTEEELRTKYPHYQRVSTRYPGLLLDEERLVLVIDTVMDKTKWSKKNTITKVCHSIARFKNRRK